MARKQGPGLMSQAPAPRINAAERRAINRGEMQAPQQQAPRVNAAERRMINQGQMPDPRAQQSRPQPMPQQQQQPYPQQNGTPPPMQGQPGQGFKSPIAPSQPNQWMSPQMPQHLVNPGFQLNPGVQFNGGSQQQPSNHYAPYQQGGGYGMPMPQQFQQYQQSPYIGNQPMPQGSGLSWNWQQRKY